MSVQLAVLTAKTKEDLIDIAANGMFTMEFKRRISRAGKGSFEIECHSPHPTYVYNRGHPKVNDSLRKFLYFSLD
jgi:hypothetical protein